MSSNSRQLQINLKLNSVFIGNISIINLKLVYTHANTNIYAWSQIIVSMLLRTKIIGVREKSLKLKKLN